MIASVASRSLGSATSSTLTLRGRCQTTARMLPPDRVRVPALTRRPTAGSPRVRALLPERGLPWSLVSGVLRGLLLGLRDLGLGLVRLRLRPRLGLPPLLGALRLLRLALGLQLRLVEHVAGRFLHFALGFLENTHSSLPLSARQVIRSAQPVNSPWIPARPSVESRRSAPWPGARRPRPGHAAP